MWLLENLMCLSLCFSWTELFYSSPPTPPCFIFLRGSYHQQALDDIFIFYLFIISFSHWNVNSMMSGILFPICHSNSSAWNSAWHNMRILELLYERMNKWMKKKKQQPCDKRVSQTPFTFVVRSLCMFDNLLKIKFLWKVERICVYYLYPQGSI